MKELLMALSSMWKRKASVGELNTVQREHAVKFKGFDKIESYTAESVYGRPQTEMSDDILLKDFAEHFNPPDSIFIICGLCGCEVLVDTQGYNYARYAIRLV